MEYTYHHARRSSKSSNGEREQHKSSCCHNFIQKDKCFNRFFCQWNHHNALALLYALFVVISILMPIAAETTTELPEEITTIYTSAIVNEASKDNNYGNEITSEDTTVGKNIANEVDISNDKTVGKNIENEVDISKDTTVGENIENEVDISNDTIVGKNIANEVDTSNDTIVGKNIENEVDISNDKAENAANSVENDESVDTNFEINDNGEIQNFEQEVSTTKYGKSIQDFSGTFTEEKEKAQEVGHAQHVFANFDNDLMNGLVPINDYPKDMLNENISVDDSNENTTTKAVELVEESLNSSASSSESESNEVAKESSTKNNITEVPRTAESVVKTNNSNELLGVGKSQKEAELEPKKSNNSQILSEYNTNESTSNSDESESSEESKETPLKVNTDDDSSRDNGLPTHFQINEDEEDTEKDLDVPTTQNPITSTTLPAKSKISDQSGAPAVVESLQDLLAVELPIEMAEEEENQAKHTQETEHNIIKKPGVVIDEQLLEALESNTDTEALQLTTEADVIPPFEKDIIEIKSEEIAAEQFADFITLRVPAEQAEDIATTIQPPADESPKKELEPKLTTESSEDHNEAVEDHNETLPTTTEFITSKGSRSVYPTDTVAATLHETYQPHVAGQTFNDNLADERVADIEKSSRAQSVQKASISTNSIIIAVTSCIALMLLLIVGTMFLISFRRQHGTLDIEMSEQKCGKYNLEDGEDGGDTFMKLLDVELPRSSMLMFAEETAIASSGQPDDDEECL